MSTEIKIWPGRQITTCQWYNCCCDLDPDSWKLSTLLITEALHFLMWGSSGISISQCFHKSSTGGPVCFFACISGRGNYFYSQLRGGKDLELLIPAVFWQPLAYGWNSQVFPQDLVTSRPSVSLIVIPSATNVHLLYTWSLFSFSKCCDGWQSCGRICTFFFFFKEVWRSLIRSWVHWLNRSFAYVQNTFIFA